MNELTSLENRTNRNMNEHLANERTFLAWIRTGIATISFGFVIARFSFWLHEIAFSIGTDPKEVHTRLSLPIGISMVAFGAIMTLFASLRYRAIQKAIELNLPHPGPTLIMLTTLTVFVLAIILIVYLLYISGQFS